LGYASFAALSDGYALAVGLEPTHDPQNSTAGSTMQDQPRPRKRQTSAIFRQFCARLARCVQVRFFQATMRVCGQSLK